jgi:hypothetical protein
MNGNSSERSPTTIFDNNEDLEPRSFSLGSSADSEFLSVWYDFGAHDASVVVLVSITFTVKSTDFASEEDVLSAVCDSKI